MTFSFFLKFLKCDFPIFFKSQLFFLGSVQIDTHSTARVLLSPNNLFASRSENILFFNFLGFEKIFFYTKKIQVCFETEASSPRRLIRRALKHASFDFYGSENQDRKKWCFSFLFFPIFFGLRPPPKKTFLTRLCNHLCQMYFVHRHFRAKARKLSFFSLDQFIAHI